MVIFYSYVSLPEGTFNMFRFHRPSQSARLAGLGHDIGSANYPQHRGTKNADRLTSRFQSGDPDEKISM